MNETIADLLLVWYDQHGRKLPWRGLCDPYRTWVSETMLQQTRVDTVMGYYERFLRRFPDVQTLAAAPEADVLKCWEGLGYYSRARNLHQAAQQVMTQFGGQLPSDVTALRTLRGVGAYTAGAVASIAFQVQTAAVDGNVIRVVSRLMGIRENVGVPNVRRRIEAEAEKLVPPERPGDFNQAMMDLGAMVCTPGTPDCTACPLRTRCNAFLQGDAENLPMLPKKKPPRTLVWDVLLIFHGGRVLMRQRTESMLHGLWVFPMLPGHGEERAWQEFVRQTGLVLRKVQVQGDARHVFTHQIWQMRLYTMEGTNEPEGVEAPKKIEAPKGYRYVTLAEMKALTLPTAMRAAAEMVEKYLLEEGWAD